MRRGGSVRGAPGGCSRASSPMVLGAPSRPVEGSHSDEERAAGASWAAAGRSPATGRGVRASLERGTDGGLLARGRCHVQKSCYYTFGPVSRICHTMARRICRKMAYSAATHAVHAINRPEVARDFQSCKHGLSNLANTAFQHFQRSSVPGEHRLTSRQSLCAVATHEIAGMHGTGAPAALDDAPNLRSNAVNVYM